MKVLYSGVLQTGVNGSALEHNWNVEQHYLEIFWPVEGIWWNGVILRKYEDEVYEIKLEGDYQVTGKNCYHLPHYHVRNIRRPSTPVKNFWGRAIYDAELIDDEDVVYYVCGCRERETDFAGLGGEVEFGLSGSRCSFGEALGTASYQEAKVLAVRGGLLVMDKLGARLAKKE